MPGASVGAGDTAANKTDRAPVHTELLSQRGDRQSTTEHVDFNMADGGKNWTKKESKGKRQGIQGRDGMAPILCGAAREGLDDKGTSG